MERLMTLDPQVSQGFVQRYGVAPTFVVRAPGRDDFNAQTSLASGRMGRPLGYPWLCSCFHCTTRSRNEGLASSAELPSSADQRRW
jgi:hypothetical protein